MQEGANGAAAQEHAADNPDDRDEKGNNDADQVTSINIIAESKSVNDNTAAIEDNNSNRLQQGENYSQPEQKETAVGSFEKSSVSLQSPKPVLNREETSEQASKDADLIHEILNDSHNVQIIELLRMFGPISYDYRKAIQEVCKERYDDVSSLHSCFRCFKA